MTAAEGRHQRYVMSGALQRLLQRQLSMAFEQWEAAASALRAKQALDDAKLAFAKKCARRLHNMASHAAFGTWQATALVCGMLYDMLILFLIDTDHPHESLVQSYLVANHIAHPRLLFNHISRTCFSSSSLHSPGRPTGVPERKMMPTMATKEALAN